MAKKLARPSGTGIIDKKENEDLTRKRDVARKMAAKKQANAKMEARTLAKQQVNAERIASASEELSASIDQANAASEQLKNLMGISTDAAESVRLKGEMLAHSAEEVNTAATESKDLTIDYQKTIDNMNVKATDTLKAVSELDSSVGDTTDKVLGSAKLIGQLKDRAENIRDIVAVVTRIADQTNLLALNAAIEAARAGEHGRGFAVVADEVRTLAEVSEKSADEIKTVINDSLAQVEKVVDSVFRFEHLSRGNLKKMNFITGACETIKGNSDNISGIIENVADQVQIVHGVAEDVNEQVQILSTSVEQIAAACEEASKSTDEQASAFAEASEASAELANMADDLRASTDMEKSSEEIAASAEELSATVEELDVSASEINTAISEVSTGAAQISNSFAEINTQITNEAEANLKVLGKEWEEIDKIGQSTGNQLEMVKCLDHIIFIEELEDCINNNKKFLGQLDPCKCAFGHWYGTYQPENAEEEKAYNGIKEPHDAVHMGAADAIAQLKDGNISEAKEILKEKVKPAVDSFKGLFKEFHHGIEMVATGIHDTTGANNTIIDEVKDLDREFSKVNKIVETINNVSIQTNMLAVNGHIEAARAGEFGRGFSVVAGDIRSLANESAGNADKIRDILDDMKDQIILVRNELGTISVMIQNQIGKAGTAVENLTGITVFLRNAIDLRKKNQVKVQESISEVEKAVKVICDAKEEVANLETTSGTAAQTADEQIQEIKEIAHAAEDVASLADEMQNG